MSLVKMREGKEETVRNVLHPATGSDRKTQPKEMETDLQVPDPGAIEGSAGPRRSTAEGMQVGQEVEVLCPGCSATTERPISFFLEA